MDIVSLDREVLLPPLKWAGGKRWLVPSLQKLWQVCSSSELELPVRFVDPFAGGMAIPLGLQPQQALVNDINPHVINFYRHLQKGLTIGIPMENDSDFYYCCRRRFNRLILQEQANTREAAQLFYYLNRTGYNGLCRFNSSGYFNVPFGKYKTLNYVRDLTSYASVLQNWQFAAVDFAELAIASTDFIYADSPYDVEFTQYSAEKFKWKEQVRLAEWLAAHPGPVAASNQATDRVLDLYRKLGFFVAFVSGPRKISCSGDRTPAKEVLAIRNIYRKNGSKTPSF